MKRLLFVITLLTVTTTVWASSTFTSKSLVQQYKTQRKNITAQCAKEANAFMYITRNRDAGVPIDAVINYILGAIEQEQKFTTKDALFGVGLVTIVYYSPLTQEEIFNSQFRICEKESLDILNTMYKPVKELNNEK